MPGNSSFVRTDVPNLSGWEKRPKPLGFIGQSLPDKQVTKEMFYALETHEERLKLLMRLKRAAWVAVDFSGSRATGTYQVKKLSPSGVITLYNNVDHEMYTTMMSDIHSSHRIRSGSSIRHVFSVRPEKLLKLHVEPAQVQPSPTLGWVHPG